jgi:hypothetical protein
MERVLEDTRRYAHELLVEHEKLRAHSLALETQGTRLAEERDELRAALLASEKDGAVRAERAVELEQKNTHLTLLCGAAYRLFHGPLERGAVLQRIREVVADVVGSEEIAVFGLAPDRPVLRLEQSFGVERALPEIALGRGRIGHAVQQGEIWVAGRPSAEALPGEADLEAAIPLVAEGRALGALAVFRLLPQKPRLERHDLDTFELLATHAGAALHCASVLARARSPLAS